MGVGVGVPGTAVGDGVIVGEGDTAVNVAEGGGTAVIVLVDCVLAAGSEMGCGVGGSTVGGRETAVAVRVGLVVAEGTAVAGT